MNSDPAVVSRRVRRLPTRTEQPPPVPEKTRPIKKLPVGPRSNPRPLLAEARKRLSTGVASNPQPVASTSLLAEQPQRKSNRLVPKDKDITGHLPRERHREPAAPSHRREATDPEIELLRLRQELDSLKQVSKTMSFKRFP